MKRANRLSTFKVVISGIFCGCLLVIFLAERDLAFHAFILKKLQNTFEVTYQARMKATVHHFSLFEPALYLTNVRAQALDNSSWSWHAERMELKGSWWSLIKSGVMGLEVSIHGLSATSESGGILPAIVEHLRCLIGGDTGYPLGMNSLCIMNSMVHLHDEQRQLIVQASCAGQASIGAGGAHVDFYVGNGIVKHRDQVEATDLWLHTRLNVPHMNIANLEATIEGAFTEPQLPEPLKLWQIHGLWVHEQGEFTLNDANQNCSIHLHHIMYTKGEIKALMEAQAAIDQLATAAGFFSEQMAGTLHAHAMVQYAHKTLHVSGEVIGNDLMLAGFALGMSKLTFDTHKKGWSGIVTFGKLALQNDPLCSASWYFDNEQRLLTIIGQQNLAGQDNQHETFQIKVLCDEHLIPHTLDYFLSGRAAPSIHIDRPDERSIRGHIDYNLIRPALERYSGLSLPGTSTLELKARRADDIIVIDGALKDGTIHVPTLYNFMRSLNCSLRIDYRKKIVTLDYIKLSFEKGFVLCQQGLIRFSDEFKPTSIFVPCLLNKVFINNGKQLYASISGDIALTRSPTKAQLDGRIIVDRAHLKRNLFSTDLQKNLISSIAPKAYTDADDIELAIELITRNPLQVKTSFLKAAAKARMIIAGTLQQPSISGVISIPQGQLLFPYRPLTIVSGHVNFLPNQIYDPLIELVAKGRVRSYLITMRAQGSLHSPHITFESTPPLSQEQIVTLLLAGSSEGALSLIMPALVMQQVTNVIFGPEQTQSKLERYFKSLLSPLRHIRFVPSFADQSARGGFRGAIEVEVNDQLRGLIQKNFSLPEDTKIEVEYAVSDDMTVRGIKDERGDLGGEVEMRWKF